MTDSINERTPKLAEGLNVLERLKNQVVSLDVRLTTLSTRLIGSGVKATEETGYAENKTNAENDDSDGLGQIVQKGNTVSKLLKSLEETLSEIETEV